MGPKNLAPKGFNRISSKLSRNPVAHIRASIFVANGWVRFHCDQYFHRPRDVIGSEKSFARDGSRRGVMLPPGKQRSPGCLTFNDRLFKMRLGSPDISLWSTPGPSKTSTPALVCQLTVLSKNIFGASARSCNLRIMWANKADLSFKIANMVNICHFFSWPAIADSGCGRRIGDTARRGRRPRSGIRLHQRRPKVTGSPAA